MRRSKRPHVDIAVPAYRIRRRGVAPGCSADAYRETGNGLLGSRHGLGPRLGIETTVFSAGPWGGDAVGLPGIRPGPRGCLFFGKVRNWRRSPPPAPVRAGDRGLKRLQEVHQVLHLLLREA